MNKNLIENIGKKDFKKEESEKVEKKWFLKKSKKADLKK